MYRDIKFRGMSVNGWVYGYYIVMQDDFGKATPAKPQMRAMEGFRLYEASVQVCPCCKEMIVNVWTRAEYQPNYCHYCGQALDWSDSD